jgi:hypothetical protein
MTEHRELFPDAEPLGPCDVCAVPVYPGEARYSVVEHNDQPGYRHWACHQRRLDEWDVKLKKVPELTERARNLIAKLKNFKV